MSTTFYYDPMLDVHHRLPVAAALTTSFYAAPQVPADARRLFDAACSSAGLDRPLSLPLTPGRGAGSSLVLAREWEIVDLASRLADGIEISYEPIWDRRLGEFTWGMGLDEAHPRGQFNAFLAAAEATGPGSWDRLSAAPLDACPQVVGVDFPAIALSRAEWHDGALYLTLAPLRDAPAERTTLTIAGMPGTDVSITGAWTIDGAEAATVDVSDQALEVTVPVVAADLVLSPS